MDRARTFTKRTMIRDVERLRREELEQNIEDVPATEPALELAA